MDLDINFKTVCESLKKDGAQDSKLIEAVDVLLGLTTVCAPIALGSVAVGLLPVLTAKNELVKIGRLVFSAATKKQRDDYFARLELMRTAHGLLVYTAFFEALDRAIPDDLRRRVDLKAEERRVLASKAAKAESDPRLVVSPSSSMTVTQPSQLAEVPIAFPHPTQSIQEQTETHQELWKQLADGFWRFIQMLAVWDELKESERKSLRKTIDSVPKRATNAFVAQYFELSRQFPDFAIWANLHQHATTQAKVSRLADRVNRYIAVSRHSQNAVDLGLAKLCEAITKLDHCVREGDAANILDGLARHYAARLDDPIIEDKEALSEEGPKLKFPKVRDAFVPQQFRVVRATSSSLHLEDEKTWSELPARDDLGPFLLSHLLSPFSAEAPLLILGHPGSGKSLLTKVLAAQLAARGQSVVRVPLREVDADVGIVAQIEDAIGQVTKRRVDAWATFGAGFRDHPPVVILDGYDELLQASGKVYAGYLRDVQAFQKSESEQDRPVRVIVTSRVTLIDKAAVPSGTTVLRLLEFDARRQQSWIAVWNAANASYFREAKTEEFRLPGMNQPGAEKILSLAGQPLLLLMLALYDSQDNQLHKSVALDRTRLYDELLRRFITRERAKDRAFLYELSKSEQNAEIETDMRRLGVAAIGMYNRRQVHILAEELEADLQFFDMVKPVAVAEGRPMSQADLLLGSFFFVHKSQAKRGDAAAFEFLHNTLGEFLTADFILRWAIDEVQALAALKDRQALLQVFHEKMNSPDGLRRQWFACLIYTPLFTRPVVLEMMHEWSGHLLDERLMSRDEFAGHLNLVLNNQIERLISKRAMPSIMRNETVDERFRARFGDHPLVGHIAVYSLNLLLLRVIVCERPFVMDEEAVRSYEDGARPWDRLVHLWRSWFSLEALFGLTAVIECVRKGAVVEVRAKPTFQVAEARGRLDVLLSVAVAVADDLTAAVSGLAHCEDARPQVLETQGIARRLDSERIEAAFQIAVRELQDATRSGEAEASGVRELLRRANDAMQIAIRERTGDDVERVALLLAYGARAYVAGRRWVEDGPFEPGRNRHVREELGRATDMLFFDQLIERSPEAALTWVKAIKLLAGDRVVCGPSTEAVIDRLGYRGRNARTFFRESPTSLVALVGVIRELAPVGSWRRMPHGLFGRLFHPGMLRHLVSVSPEAALAFLQSAHELEGDSEQFLRHMGPEVMRTLLDPRYLLALAEQSLEATAGWARLLREWREGKALREIDAEIARKVVQEFVQRIVDTPYLLELFERSPEMALEVVRVVQTLGGHDVLCGVLHTELLRRLSDLPYLLQLSERSPEAVVIAVQLLEELKGDSERLWRQFGPHVMQRLLDPRYLLALAEWSPEAIAAWARLLREWRDGNTLREGDAELTSQVVHGFVQRVVDTPYFFKLIERSPETALEVVRVVQALGGRDGPPDFFAAAFLERLADRRFLLRLSERSPGAAVAMARLLLEIGSGSGRMWRDVGRDVAQQFLDPEYLLDLSERSPECALSLTRIGSQLESDARNWHGRFRSLWDPSHVESVLRDWLTRPTRDPRGFAAALFFARRLRSSDTLRRLAEAVEQAVQRESLFLVVPLAVYDDLHWLAGREEAKQVREALLRVVPAVSLSSSKLE